MTDVEPVGLWVPSHHGLFVINDLAAFQRRALGRRSASIRASAFFTQGSQRKCPGGPYGRPMTARHRPHTGAVLVQFESAWAILTVG